MSRRWKLWFADKLFHLKEALARPWRRGVGLVRTFPARWRAFWSGWADRWADRWARLRRSWREEDRSTHFSKLSREDKSLLAEQKKREREERRRDARRGWRVRWGEARTNFVDFFRALPAHWRDRREEMWWTLVRWATLGTAATVLILGTLGGTLYFWALPTYRAWKAEVFYRNAVAQLEDDDLRGAYLTLRLALIKDFGSLPVNLLMARWADKAGHAGNALFYRERLATLLLPGDEEQVLAWISSAERFGRPDKVLEAMTYLTWERQRATGMDWTHYRALRATGAADRAEETLRRILEAEPRHPQARPEVLMLSLNAGPGHPGFNRLVDELQEWAGTGDELAIRIYFRLMEAHRIAEYFPEALYWARRLLPLMKEEDPRRVIVWEVMQQAGANRAAARLARQVEETILARTGASGLRTSYSMALLRQDRAEDARTLYLVLQEAFPEDVLFALEYARILLRLEAWAELREILPAARWDHRDYLRHALLARAHRALGYERDFQEEWFLARKKALGEPVAARVLANLAGEFGWMEEQFALLREILRRHPGEEWALNPLFRHFTRRGNYQELEEFVTNHLFYFPPPPDHPLLAFQERWQLLRGETGEPFRRRLEERFAAHPDDLNLTINVLLAAWLASDEDRVKALLAGISPEQIQEFARLGWYVAIMEMLVGDAREGRQLWHNLPGIPLLPEETALETRALARAAE